MPLIEELNISLFLGILLGVLVANYFLFKKLLFSFVDPIWFLVIINTTVTLTLILYDKSLDGDFFSGTVCYVLLAHLGFIGGARLTRWLLTRQLSLSYLQGSDTNTRDQSSAISLLKMSTVFLLFIAAYYVATGLPALAADPELARVLSKRGGGGVVARLFNVFSYLSLTLWFYCRLKKIKLGFLWSFLSIGLPLFLLLFVGAKASLLFVYIALFYVSYYVSFEEGRVFRFSWKYFFITALLVLCVSFVLLFARAGEAGASDSSLEFASFQLLGRIAFSGVGAAHYFSNHIPSLENMNAMDYLYQYIVLPVLAPLRFFDYEPTVGSLLAISITGDDTFGPNPSMYAEGHIYFGPVFGVIYCGILGAVFSVFRYLPLRFKRPTSAMRVILFSFGSMLIMSMTYDMILFVGDFTNCMFFVAPILFVFVLVRASLRQAPNPAKVV